MHLLEPRGHRLQWMEECDGPGQEGREGERWGHPWGAGETGPAGGRAPTCSSSRLCSFRRASIFPMTSWSRLLSSSMSRCCWPSLSCSAVGPRGAQGPPTVPVGWRGGEEGAHGPPGTSELLVPLPEPQLPLLGGGEVRGLHAGG